MGSSKGVYGIGNPLIDIIVQVEESELAELGIHKGAMHLIDEKRREELLQFVQKRKASYALGGSCPNTIITLASLGIGATLAGKIGEDSYGHLYKERLKELGVADELVVCDKPTGSSIIFITPDKERTMNTFLGANRHYGQKDVEIETLTKSDFFHFTGYMWDTKSQQSSIMFTLENLAKECVVSFDVADPFAVARNRDAFLSLISDHCDVVFANSEEARILFDNYDPYECCKSMGKLCDIAVVKNGKLGSYVSYKGTITKIAVQGPVPPVDTTGAGDVYAAGFIYGLLYNLKVEEAAFIASLLAGEIVQQRGAQLSPEKAAELQALLKKRYQIK